MKRPSPLSSRTRAAAGARRGLGVLLLLGAPLCGCASRSIALTNLTEKGGNSQWVWPYFLDGQPAVLAFWSTNEMQCLRDVPSLKTLDRMDQHSVQLITVVTGRDRLEIDRWIRNERIGYVVLNDPQEKLAARLGVERYPTYIYFDTRGKEVERREDVRLVKRWFDHPRWLERSGARDPSTELEYDSRALPASARTAGEGR